MGRLGWMWSRERERVRFEMLGHVGELTSGFEGRLSLEVKWNEDHKYVEADL